jgi:hypothetical protein
VLALLIDSFFLCLLLVLFALQLPETIVAAATLCGIYAINRPRLPLFNKQGLISVLLIMLVLMVVVIIRNDQRYQPIIYMFASGFAFFGAKRFASLPLAHVRRCLEFAFWLAVVGIAVGLVIYWGEPEPLGQIISGSSTNGLPSYLIVLQVAVSIAVYLDRGRMPMLSAVATFVVAMFGLGRGSIIISLMILMVSLAANIWISTRCRTCRAHAAYLVGAVLVALFGGGYLLMNFYELVAMISDSKWGVWGLMDPPRAQMANDYLAKLDAASLLVGSNYAGTSINELYGGNPHNSYIRLHSYFGLPGVLLVLFSPLLIFMSCREFLSQLIVGVLILLILVRAITEPILFPTALDFFYFLNIFLFLRYASVR